MLYQVHLTMDQETLTSAEEATMETTYKDYKSGIFYESIKWGNLNTNSDRSNIMTIKQISRLKKIYFWKANSTVVLTDNKIVKQ